MVEEWQGLRMEKSDTGESSGEHRKARSPEQGHPASERRGTAVYGSGRRRCTRRCTRRLMLKKADVRTMRSSSHESGWVPDDGKGRKRIWGSTLGKE